MLASVSFGLCRTSANGQPSTGQTPAQVTCAHCQRSWNRPQRRVPCLDAEALKGAAHHTADQGDVNNFVTSFLSAAPPLRFRCGEPTILARFSAPSTPEAESLPLHPAASSGPLR